LRQAFFVALAVAGIAIGYGLGYLTKEEPAPAPSAAAKAETEKPMVVREPSPRSDTEPAATAPPSRLAPKPPRALIRAYEEPLTQEVIEGPPVPETPPPAPVKAPEVKQEPGPEPKLKPEPKAEPKPETVAAPKESPKAGPKPRIVIVIDDLGIDKPRTARTIKLPGPLTLSFLTYASGLGKQTRDAKAAGHELLLHIPMEPGSPDVDPGPNVLLTGIPKPELLASLKWNLEQFSGYVGVNNHMGSRFTSDLAGVKTVMEELEKRGLLFLDSVTSGKSVARKAARETGVRFASRNVFLDHQDDKVGIEHRLAEVERLARRNGLAVAIGHPREKTLLALGPWLKGLEAKGFRLVPLSHVVRGP